MNNDTKQTTTAGSDRALRAGSEGMILSSLPVPQRENPSREPEPDREEPEHHQEPGPAGRQPRGSRSKTLDAAEVPLYLLPRVISCQISTFGNAVYRISVKRSHWHHYCVSVRTKSLVRELVPEPVRTRGSRRECAA